MSSFFFKYFNKAFAITGLLFLLIYLYGRITDSYIPSSISGSSINSIFLLFRISFVVRTAVSIDICLFPKFLFLKDGCNLVMIFVLFCGGLSPSIPPKMQYENFLSLIVKCFFAFGSRITALVIFKLLLTFPNFLRIFFSSFFIFIKIRLFFPTYFEICIYSINTHG